MSKSEQKIFSSVMNGVGKIGIRGKTLLIPEMDRIGSHLLAAVFRSFGIEAKVLETYRGIELGKQFTSGKECFPCQITIGDILWFVKQERSKGNFDPERYLYFMPETDGPCRFGMYNKYQRMVLNSFPETKDLRIVALTTGDGYSLEGLVERDVVRNLRKSAYFSVVVADIVNRLVWRVRPYERRSGETDDLVDRSLSRLVDLFERYSSQGEWRKIEDGLGMIFAAARDLVDTEIPRKPRIGIIGEIYVRSHEKSNQDTIRVIEKYGGEVVNASLAEWINYTTYSRLRDAKRELNIALMRLDLDVFLRTLKKVVNFAEALFYQEVKLSQLYKQFLRWVDIHRDHRIGELEKILHKTDVFKFDVGTEACLGIPGAITYAREGFNGVVNVYPFTCMPGTITAAILKPVMSHFGVPFLNLAYDSSVQPNRDMAIRTFMYQANQHFIKNGGRKER
ncbi:MAG: hypothetical protein N2317_02360 [Syntrophales bacterium]|nr:hypothetical protein [Syntrophales bacterium]